MLEVRGLTWRYPSIPVADQVGFVAPPGAVTGYLGPNGSGKSTTIKMIVGLVEPSDGEAYYKGERVSRNLLDFQQRIGYVPEEPDLYPYLTGCEYLELVGSLRLPPAQRLRAKIERFLRLFGRYEDRCSPLASYSRGMRQEILLAAALLHDPEVLLLDEPFSGLDVDSMLALRRLIQLPAQAGKVILFSSHELDTVEKMCLCVVILFRGRVAACDSVERLRELMAPPALEQIFAQLALRHDPEALAGELLEVTCQ